MANDKLPSPIKASKKLKYKEQQDTYTVQLVHRRKPWWLLLLLLPLLLLIQCHKDITVTCHEPDTGAPIVDQPVTMTYHSHFVYDRGHFFTNDSISLTQKTDAKGTTVFRGLRCSVYSYIFYCLSQASFTAKSQCHAAAGEKHNFHYTSKVDLKMLPRREDLHIKLVDKETGDILPDAVLTFKYVELGKEKTDSVKADPAGVATIKQMRYCSVMKLLKGSCYGYADTTKADVPCQQLVIANDSATLKLRPIKKRFTFFVKNLETKQPIPGAECYVTLTHPRGKKFGPKKVTTSIDGKGMAFYDNAFILSVINIKAHKRHYHDSILTGGPWTVEKFLQQKPDVRTIWLRPEPYLQEFVNIDSINGRPIPGVKNRIKITHPNGKTETIEEISNRNGVFPVTAKEDDRVEIVSTKTGEYKDKRTVLPKFKNVKDKKIRMAPEMVTLQFRTVIDPSWAQLPDCQLRVSGSISGSLSPSNSGNGAFQVTFRKAERLSITASKAGYTTNSTKVSNNTYTDLNVADQRRRDIPLKQDLPPCGAGKNVPKGSNDNHHVKSYGLGKPSGVVTVDVDMYPAADKLTIYDGPSASGKIIFGPETFANKKHISVPFTKGSITVVIDADNGSDWDYTVNCP